MEIVNLTDVLTDEDKVMIDGWIASLIQSKLGVSEWIAPLGLDGKVPAAHLPSMSLTWGSITGVLADQTDLNTALGSKASTASPAFSGVPTAPNAIAGTNTLQIATTAFTKQAFENTGLIWTPNAPLQATGDNTSKVASTAFVKQEIDNITGGAELIATATLTATAVSMEFTIPTGYREVFLDFHLLLPNVSFQTLYFQVSTDGGTTWGNTDYNFTTVRATTSLSIGENQSSTFATYLGNVDVVGRLSLPLYLIGGIKRYKVEYEASNDNRLLEIGGRYVSNPLNKVKVTWTGSMSIGSTASLYGVA